MIDSVLGLVLLSSFTNGLDSGLESFLITATDHTKLGGIANMEEDRSRVQRDLELETWVTAIE